MTGSPVGRVVIVPGAPALLARYTGKVDPVAEMRQAAVDSVRWLVQDAPHQVVVLGASPDPANAARGVSEPMSIRVAWTLLAAAGFTGPVIEVTQSEPLPPLSDGDALLVVADGTARRHEKAPGHIDERAFGYDDEIVAALRSADTQALAELDPVLGKDLLAGGVGVLQAVGDVLRGSYRAEVCYAGDPFGVMYWVVRWECES